MKLGPVLAHEFLRACNVWSLEAIMFPLLGCFAEVIALLCPEIIVRQLFGHLNKERGRQKEILVIVFHTS